MGRRSREIRGLNPFNISNIVWELVNLTTLNRQTQYEVNIPPTF